MFTSLPLVYTLNPDFWGDVFDLAPSWSPNLLFMKITVHYGSRIKTSPDWWTSQIPELRRILISELRRFLILELHRFQPSDSCIGAKFGYNFRILLEGLKNTWDPSGFLHEHFPFTKLNFSPRSWFTNLSHEFRQIRRFEGVRFLPNSPTLAPRGSGLTPTIRFPENSRSEVYWDLFELSFFFFLLH
jgi:hypothetical protein